jgi:tRNA1Val (adenine37-N6)-methyltransferase
MPNPWFSFKQFTIRQENAPLKVTTDSCLLGAYAFAETPQNILDIGTGTGILAIMAAQRFHRAAIVGIEADEIAAEQAKRNAEACPWKDRITIRAGRIQDHVKKDPVSYDLILCNPPYYQADLVSSDHRVGLARHSLDLSFPELAFVVDQLIAAGGKLFVIVPPVSFTKLEMELGFYGLTLFNKLSIYNLPSRPPYRVIGGFSRENLTLKEESLLIQDEKWAYTYEYRKMLREFYLEF